MTVVSHLRGWGPLGGFRLGRGQEPLGGFRLGTSAVPVWRPGGSCRAIGSQSVMGAWNTSGMGLPTLAKTTRTSPALPTQVIRICGKVTLNQPSYLFFVVTNPTAGLSHLGSGSNPSHWRLWVMSVECVCSLLCVEAPLCFTWQGVVSPFTHLFLWPEQPSLHLTHHQG